MQASPDSKRYFGLRANAFCLNAAGRKSVARILTCVAYNSPDIQYCPYSYPVAAILRHYLSG